MTRVERVSGRSMVSVIIPTYNCAPYIRQAVESVFHQTYPAYEVIVVDDGSADDTRQVLEPYLDRIRYVYQDNQGPSAARNHGLRLAQGKFVVFLDADDFLLRDKLAEQLACFEADPSLGVIHSGWRLVNQRGEKLRDAEPWHDAPRLDLETWVWWKPVFMGAMLFRREWLDCVGPFDTQLRQSEDTDLMLQLALLGCKMAWLRKPTVCRREHDRNLTQEGKEAARYIEAVLDKFFAQPAVPYRIRWLEGRIRYHTLIWIVWWLYHIGCLDETTLCLRRSLTYTPYAPVATVYDWAGQLAMHFSRAGCNLDGLHALLPHFKAAVEFDDDLCVQVEKGVSWWTNVWWHYVHHDDARAAKGLGAYRGLAPRELVALAQSSLVVSPSRDVVALVSRFWEDARAGQLVPTSYGREVTSLYLTAFGRAFLAQQWGVAWQAVRRALRFGCHPKAVTAWFRFFHAALSYVRGRPEKA